MIHVGLAAANTAILDLDEAILGTDGGYRHVPDFN
jgi:hypothetical protein